MHICRIKAELLAHTPDPLQVIERCGRVCYKSEDKITDASAEEFVRKIIKRGHESVLEHAVFTFNIVCPRGVSHEAVRHRIAAYSQESTRYCNYSGGKFDSQISVVEPFFVGTDEQKAYARNIWLDICNKIEVAYLRLLVDAKQPPQVARDVLPICLKTELMWTANAREWRHILRLRTSSAAHPQIIYLTKQIRDWFTNNFPVLVEDLLNE